MHAALSQRPYFKHPCLPALLFIGDACNTSLKLVQNKHFRRAPSVAWATSGRGAAHSRPPSIHTTTRIHTSRAAQWQRRRLRHPVWHASRDGRISMAPPLSHPAPQFSSQPGSGGGSGANPFDAPGVTNAAAWGGTPAPGSAWGAPSGGHGTQPSHDDFDDEELDTTFVPSPSDFGGTAAGGGVPAWHNPPQGAWINNGGGGGARGAGGGSGDGGGESTTLLLPVSAGASDSVVPAVVAPVSAAAAAAAVPFTSSTAAPVAHGMMGPGGDVGRRGGRVELHACTWRMA
eukprot:358669-Chlamydomonas_euryale.AAC.1